MNDDAARDILISERKVDNVRIVVEQTTQGVLVETHYSASNDVKSVKKTYPGGGYEFFNASGVMISAQTEDGTYKEFNPKTKKLEKEITPDGTVTTFHANGMISTITKPDGRYESFYDNGALFRKTDGDYVVSKYRDGRIQYELKDGKLDINPEYFSYYKIGMKSKDEPYHWTEKFTLDPKKKTLLCLGGDQTRTAKDANGNINTFSGVMGLTDEQLSEMQLCSCYRPSSMLMGIDSIVKKCGKVDERINEDYKREILSRFMPFMAKIEDGKFERYSAEELNQNFRNIIIQAHCYGANDLVKISDIFKDTLTQLGYSKEEISNAMQQVVCVTNNTQREFHDNTGFTVFHRYSVKDGQFEPEYDNRYSDDYPVFLRTHEQFSKKKGTKAAFVSLNSKEVLLVFDKVLNVGSEHNDGFLTTKEENLTAIGREQSKLMKCIGRFWYKSGEMISDAKDFVKQAVVGTESEVFVTRALVEGKKIKAEQKNPLVNHNVLKKVWNEFNDKTIKPEKIGIFKALADRDSK